MDDSSANTSDYAPARGAVFTETMQIGIVVRDLDATIRRYVDDYGIDPWDFGEFDPGRTAEDMRIDGKPVDHASSGAVTRFATAMVGGVMWEVIQPLDEKSIWALFLAEKGEGVHHIAVATPNFDGALAAEARRSRDLVLSGTFSGIRLAYLPTGHDLGTIIEIFEGMPGDGHEPDAN